jgi:two-component system response regulator RegA
VDRDWKEPPRPSRARSGGSRERQGAALADGPRQQPTVLIVDDEAAPRENLATWFRGAGCHVRLAATCTEALSVAAVALPDRVLVEQRLTDGSGLELFPRLRALSPGLSGVVLTRYPSIAGAVHAIRIGFRDYLAKPADWVHLAALFGIAPPERVIGRASPANDTANDATNDGPESYTLARAEWEHIQAVLFACCGNISEAARVLGVHRRSLQRKLRRIAPT